MTKPGFNTTSAACPECRRFSRVLRTAREPNNVDVRRERECEVGHRFETLETFAVSRPRLTPSEAALKRWSNR